MPDISQGRVVTHLRCGGIFNVDYEKFTAEAHGERILEIGQQFTKLEARVQWQLYSQ